MDLPINFIVTGERKIKVRWCFAEISVSCFLRWKEALSITITTSSGRYNKRQCSNQNSNSVLSVMPWYCIGAIICDPNFAAMIFVRWNFRPGILSYSIDLREWLIKYRLALHTIKETCEVFGVGIYAVSKWAKQYKETGDLSKESLNKSRLTAQYASCLHIVRHPA